MFNFLVVLSVSFFILLNKKRSTVLILLSKFIHFLFISLFNFLYLVNAMILFINYLSFKGFNRIMAFITLLLETIVFLLLYIMYSMAFGEFFLKLFNLSCVLALPILAFINKNRSTLFILIDMLTQFCYASIIFLFLFSQTCIFIHLMLERVLQLLNLHLALFLFLLAFID